MNELRAGSPPRHLFTRNPGYYATPLGLSVAHEERVLTSAVVGEFSAIGGPAQHAALLQILIDRLPAFHPWWSKEKRDQWFDWFFELHAATQRLERRPRLATAADFGIGLPRDSDRNGVAAETVGLSPEGESAGRQASPNL